MIHLSREKREMMNLVLPNSNINVENFVEQSTVPTIEQHIQHLPSKIVKTEEGKINVDTLIHDLGKHPQIWNYPINQQDEIRRSYIKGGPYQFIMDV